mgnify:CR=1 FL=1
MRKKKSLFITFEGIEGSGKSYLSKKLFIKLKKLGLPVILTREPGGTKGAEIIRNVILKDYFQKDYKEKFNKYTDTLLYLAARNEHIEKKIKPAIGRGKIVICDRFVDSTIAYQVYGKRVSKNLIDVIHKHILNNVKPDITFFLKVSIKKAMYRLNKRKIKNRYDKFSKNFYAKVQNAFIKISKKDRSRCVILDNSNENNLIEGQIYNKIKETLNL